MHFVYSLPYTLFMDMGSKEGREIKWCFISVLYKHTKYFAQEFIFCFQINFIQIIHDLSLNWRVLPELGEGLSTKHPKWNLKWTCLQYKVIWNLAFLLLNFLSWQCSFTWNNVLVEEINVLIHTFLWSNCNYWSMSYFYIIIAEK